MKTFSVQSLGCKVNQYEGDQIADVLRTRGLVPVPDGEVPDIRVINTCSVTVQAAAKSRQMVRRATSLPVIETGQPRKATVGLEGSRTIVTGCWATSDTAAARSMQGVDAVLTHDDNVPERLHSLLDEWSVESACSTGLPAPSARQSHTRAFLKVQDGCDAHCTYCIIPQLRKRLWTKPIPDVVDEARRLVEAGHKEIVLTGIFLGAFGQSTALRRRQLHGSALPALAEALCANVPGLLRLRLSSLEPGDLSADLLAVLRSHKQLAPHFHLPLQSGSDMILRRMNRQYARHDYLRMIDQVNAAFDRPAITTDVIVGFPGETDSEFSHTLEVVEHARCIHVHAFHFSPRPGTAAARWKRAAVPGTVVNERIRELAKRSAQHNHEFRQQFVGETVEVIVERGEHDKGMRHGRCSRYFEVRFRPSGQIHTGDSVTVRIRSVDGDETLGEML